MSEYTNNNYANEAIFFGEKLAHSETFRVLFRDGMNLVEETAAYLDGRGRDHAKDLPRSVSLAYATESMRLTTRLMQLASWLLLQRAVNEGEMSLDQASKEKNKIRIGGITPTMAGEGWEGLPEDLQDLIKRSTRMQERIQHLDDLIYQRSRPNDDVVSNPVGDAFGRLQNAFDMKSNT